VQNAGEGNPMTDDLDFSAPKPAAPKPAASKVPSYASSYDPVLAHEFFKLAGTPESVAEGATIFAENEKANRLLLKRDKMYLLLEGEVNLVARNKVLGSVKKGEIFGEMASIGQATRTATAMAKRASRVIGIDDKEFQNGLRKMPDFALMLMSVMIGRLRETIARLNAGSAASADGKWKETTVFDKSQTAVLVRALGDQSLVAYEREKAVMKEGDAGVLMYVVLEGRVAVSIRGTLIEKVGPGGVFGEMALVDRTPRLATATAETNCSLLAINRNTFLNLVKASPDFAVSLLAAISERARSVTSRRA
jgi:CRP/FNR family transcriptional regulator, cyclic AMP receptor protein